MPPKAWTESKHPRLGPAAVFDGLGPLRSSCKARALRPQARPHLLVAEAQACAKTPEEREPRRVNVDEGYAIPVDQVRPPDVAGEQDWEQLRLSEHLLLPSLSSNVNDRVWDEAAKGFNAAPTTVAV